ncbi:MAG TPA: hypothetical protein VNT50_04095, partial [Microbacterium sp.]|uniref:hypothetical protein n=1 Tax=Microbacterium sp. TaxID=51671 RepID=UPI002CB15A07
MVQAAAAWHGHRSMREREGSAVLLADGVRRRIDAIVEDLMERQWREVPELWVTDEPAFREAVARSTRDNVDLMVAALGRPTRAPLALPPGARLETDAAARYGARIDALLRTYRLGQHAMTEHFLDVIEEGDPAEASIALRQLRTAMRTVYDYMDAVVPMVWREYDDERSRLATHPDIGRLRAVQAALAGNAAEAASLGYDTTGEHVAVVAGHPDAEAVLSAVAAALGVAALAVRATDGRCWAWVATGGLGRAREAVA